MKKIQHRFLVADANDQNRQLVTKLLTDLGYPATGCARGDEAITEITKLRPEFIITDVQLPVVDGLELARKVKEDNPDTVVAFTSAALSRYCENIQGVFTDVPLAISKPVTQSNLALLVNQMTQTRHFLQARSLKSPPISQLPTLPDTTTINDALSVMYEKNVGALAILKDDELCGLFSQRSVLESYATNWKKMTVGQALDQNFVQNPSIPSELETSDLVTRGIRFAVLPDGHGYRQVNLDLLNRYYVSCAHERDRLRSLPAELLVEIMASTDDAIGVFDREFNIQYLSPSWSATCGLDDTGSEQNLASYIHPGSQETFKETHERLLSGENINFFVLKIRAATGDYRTVSWHLKYRGERIFGIGRDVTERSALQNEIESSKMQSYRQYRLAELGQVSASITHEINNPLSIARAKIALIKQLNDIELKSPALGTRCDELYSTITRVSDIVRAVRDLAFDSGDDPAEPRSIAYVIDQAIMIANAKINQQGCSINTTVPDIPIPCRMSALIQLFLNLINNAVDAIYESENREIRVTGQLDAGSILLRVANHGTIPKEMHSQIFEPFYSSKDPSHGSGLGLSICKQIVQSHHGELWLETVQNATHFCVRLPIINKTGGSN